MLLWNLRRISPIKQMSVSTPETATVVSLDRDNVIIDRVGGVVLQVSVCLVHFLRLTLFSTDLGNWLN